MKLYSNLLEAKEASLLHKEKDLSRSSFFFLLFFLFTNLSLERETEKNDDGIIFLIEFLEFSALIKIHVFLGIHVVF